MTMIISHKPERRKCDHIEPNFNLWLMLIKPLPCDNLKIKNKNAFADKSIFVFDI